MPATASAASDTLTREFEGAWRDETPIFGCCRKAVTTAIEHADMLDIASLDATARVQALRVAVEAELPAHLGAHRCCAGHLADLAFDLPDLLAPVSADED